MFKKNKTIILYSLGAYLLGFFIISNEDDLKGKDKSVEEKEVDRGAVSTNVKARSQGSNSSQDNFASFVKRLESNLSADDCEKMFEEIFSYMNQPASLPINNSKMQFLLEKWGKVAPKQALEKIKSTGGAQYWVLPVFRGWMEKSPENAVTYYNESQDPLIKNSYLIPFAIVSGWTNYSPQQAWDWIQTPGNKASWGNNYQFYKNTIIKSLVDKHPDQIPQFIGKFSEDDLESNAYLLGEKWVPNNAEAREWLEKLPERSRVKAEAGEIMALSKGNLDSIKKQLASFDEEKQKMLFTELATPLLNESRLDMQERVDWIMDMMTEDTCPSHIKTDINKWLLEDWDNSRKWVDSLPPGEKKERLLKLYHYHTRNNYYAE